MRTQGEFIIYYDPGEARNIFEKGEVAGKDPGGVGDEVAGPTGSSLCMKFPKCGSGCRRAGRDGPILCPVTDHMRAGRDLKVVPKDRVAKSNILCCGVGRDPGRHPHKNNHTPFRNAELKRTRCGMTSQPSGAKRLLALEPTNLSRFTFYEIFLAHRLSTDVS